MSKSYSEKKSRTSTPDRLLLALRSPAAFCALRAGDSATEARVSIGSTGLEADERVNGEDGVTFIEGAAASADGGASWVGRETVVELPVGKF